MNITLKPRPAWSRAQHATIIAQNVIGWRVVGHVNADGSCSPGDREIKVPGTLTDTAAARAAVEELDRQFAVIQVFAVYADDEDEYEY